MKTLYIICENCGHKVKVSNEEHLLSDIFGGICKIKDVKYFRFCLAKALADLPQREKRALELRYGLDDGKFRTYQLVGQEFCVCRARIGQIVSKALRKLRHPCRAQFLKEFI